MFYVMTISSLNEGKRINTISISGTVYTEDKSAKGTFDYVMKEALTALHKRYTKGPHHHTAIDFYYLQPENEESHPHRA